MIITSLLFAISINKRSLAGQRPSLARKGMTPKEIREANPHLELRWKTGKFLTRKQIGELRSTSLELKKQIKANQLEKQAADQVASEAKRQKALSAPSKNGILESLKTTFAMNSVKPPPAHSAPVTKPKRK